MPGREKQTNDVTRRTRTLTADEKEGVLRRARDPFEPENHFFMVAMQPSYLPPKGGTLVSTELKIY